MTDPNCLDTEEKFQQALRDGELRDVKRHARLMARTWRDLYNLIGEVPEVERAWKKVGRIVEDYE